MSRATYHKGPELSYMIPVGAQPQIGFMNESTEEEFLEKLRTLHRQYQRLVEQRFGRMTREWPLCPCHQLPLTPDWVVNLFGDCGEATWICRREMEEE